MASFLHVANANERRLRLKIDLSLSLNISLECGNSAYQERVGGGSQLEAFGQKALFAGMGWWWSTTSQGPRKAFQYYHMARTTPNG